MAPGHARQVPVPELEDQAPESGGEDEQGGQNAHTHHQERPRRRKEPRGSVGEQGPDETTRQAAETTDHGGHEDRHALLGQIGLAAEGRLAEHQQDAGRGRHPPGDGERGQLGPRGVHPEGRGTGLVVAQRHEDATGSAVAYASKDPRRQRGDGEEEVVPAQWVVEGDRSQELGPGEAPVRYPLPDAVGEHPGRGRQRQGERGHGQIEASKPKRGQSDDHRHDRPGRPRHQHRQERIPAPASHRGRPDPGAHADERHLTERDLSGPTGQDHHRESDHSVHHDDAGLDLSVGAEEQWQQSRAHRRIRTIEPARASRTSRNRPEHGRNGSHLQHDLSTTTTRPGPLGSPPDVARATPR